jgi:hypothetical protein
VLWPTDGHLDLAREAVDGGLWLGGVEDRYRLVRLQLLAHGLHFGVGRGVLEVVFGQHVLVGRDDVSDVLWFMGPAEEIFGYWGNLNHPYVEIEDNAVAVIRFRSGALGILKGTVSMNPERRIHGVTLVGESGATVSFDCWQVRDAERRIAGGPWDVGSNDIWTIPDPA